MNWKIRANGTVVFVLVVLLVDPTLSVSVTDCDNKRTEREAISKNTDANLALCLKPSLTSQVNDVSCITYNYLKLVFLGRLVTFGMH